MVTTTAVAFIILVCGVIFLLVARRVLKMAIKLALASAIIFVVLIAMGFGWWRGWFSSTFIQHPVNQSNQRANSNRRVR